LSQSLTWKHDEAAFDGGLDALLRMPTGCGEQTMIYMSPNVYALQYLSNTNQVTGDIEKKAYKFIESGI